MVEQKQKNMLKGNFWVVFLILVAIFTLVLTPWGKELVYYYSCLSLLGNENYTDALANYQKMESIRPKGQKTKDILSRINDLGYHHYNKANYYYALGKFDAAKEETKKAYTLVPRDSDVARMNTRLNLSGISAMDIKLYHEASFSGKYFKSIAIQPYWDFVYCNEGGELGRYNFSVKKIESIANGVEKFIASPDGEKFAYITLKAEGTVKTPEIRIGSRTDTKKRLKSISFRDHILKRHSGYQASVDDVALISFSPTNEYLFFQTLHEGLPTLWMYDLTKETPNTFEKVSDVSFKPDSESFCYVKKTDNNTETILYHYSKKNGRHKMFTLAGNFGISSPKWSPKGDFIAFYTTDILTGAKKLNVMRPDGRIKYSLGECEEQSKFIWSPDGTKLYYLQNGILKVWLTSNKNYILYNLPDKITYFRLSPGGTKVAFLTNKGLWMGDSQGYNRCEIKSEGIFASLEWADYGGRLAARQEENIIIFAFEHK